MTNYFDNLDSFNSLEVVNYFSRLLGKVSTDVGSANYFNKY